MLYAILCYHDENLVWSWSKDDLQAHEQMGFHQGWGQCADQLAELAQRI